jgi:hypothetical protein
MMQVHEISQIDVSVVDLGDNERLIRAGEAAAERFGRSRDHILPMARGLAAAKRKYSATREFGDWLQHSSYSRIGKQDRAALINIGEQLDEHEDFIVEFLNGTDLISPQTIMAEIRKKLQLQPRLSVKPGYYDSKSDNDSGDAARPDEATSDAAPLADDEPIEPKATAKSREFYGTDDRFDLMLLTPRKGDLKLLRDDYADPQALRNCLPLHDCMEESAAIVIATQMRDLPVMARLLPLWGFNGTRILLRQGPKSPDITDAEVLIAAQRGDIKYKALGDWPDDVAPIDVAEKLYPDASKTLHLFATKEEKAAEAKDARCIIVGDDSWFKLPSVR